MKIKYIITLIILFSITLHAQNFIGALSYNTAMPAANTSDFISDFSWRGFSIEGKTFTNRNWTFGGIFGWNIFDVKNTDLIEIDAENTGTTVKGTQIRYLNSFPIMLTGHYHFGKRKDTFRPYLGVGIGTYYIMQRFEIGVFQLEKSNWHFGLAPEAGVLLALTRTTSLLLGVKYHYAFDSGKSVFGNPDNSQSYFGINIGLAFYDY